MRSLITALMVLGTISGPALGQEPLQVRDSLEGTLRSSLRALSTAQEWYYGVNKAYSADLGALMKSPTECRVAEGVQVVIWHGSASGWAMEARRPELPGQSCVFMLGRGIPELLSLQKHLPASSKPGRVICDFDKPPQAGR